MQNVYKRLFGDSSQGRNRERSHIIEIGKKSSTALLIASYAMQPLKNGKG